MLSLVADHSLEDVPSPEILLVPGGFGSRRLLEDEQVLGWIRKAHETSQWTTSVCTGSLLLGAAGMLRRAARRRATGCRSTAWRSSAPSRRSERVVEQGKVVTAAGVSSGIDMALLLVQRIAGDDVAQAIQLSIEYDPQPPFDAGSPDKAPKHVVDLVTAAAAKLERRRRHLGAPG